MVWLLPVVSVFMALNHTLHASHFRQISRSYGAPGEQPFVGQAEVRLPISNVF